MSRAAVTGCHVCGEQHSEPPEPFPDMGKPVGERMADIFADVILHPPASCYVQVTAADHSPDLYREHADYVRGDGTCERCELEAAGRP